MRSGELHAAVRFVLSTRSDAGDVHNRGRAKLLIHDYGEPSANADTNAYRDANAYSYRDIDADTNASIDAYTNDYSHTDGNTHRVRV